MGSRLPSPAGCCVFGSSRWLVQSEDGWEDRIQKLPQEILDAFLVRSACGRAAVDIDDWGSAISEYEMCRDMLLSGRIPDHGEDEASDPCHTNIETYNWLLAWVDLPLALLYQYRAKRFDKAYYIWREILECVEPLQHLETHLVTVVRSFVRTSLLECHWAGFEFEDPQSPEAKDIAIEDRAISNDRDEREDEPYLCLLLSFDHYYFGSWQGALRWIQAAKHLWEQNLPERKEYDHIFLRCEAELLMKLLMFEKAEALLLKWLHTTDVESCPWHTRRVHQLLYECYTDWRWWIVDHGGADEIQVERCESLAQIHHSEFTWMLKVEEIQISNLGSGGQYRLLGLKFADSHGNFLLSEESRRRLGLPPSLGCSPVLALTGFSLEASDHPTPSLGETTKSSAKMKKQQDEVDPSDLQPNCVEELTLEAEPNAGLDYYLQKLPLELGVAFCIHADCGRAALEVCDWEEAIVQYQMCRQMLKLTRRAVEMGTYDWLLTWIDLPLARLYQYRANKFHKAFQLRREMLDCVRPTCSDWAPLANHVSRKPGARFSENYLRAWGLNSDNTGVSEKEKIMQMLYWIRPSNVDTIAMTTLGALADLDYSDPENPEYFLRRRRSKSISRGQWTKNLVSTIGLSSYSGSPFCFLQDTPLEYIFESFCCITLYEWASTEYPDLKDEVVKKYYEVVCSWLLVEEDEAEPHVCMQLHVEHSLAGSLEISLRWLQEAKQVLERNLPRNLRDQCHFADAILFKEADLLIQLSRFEEADRTLKKRMEAKEAFEGTSSQTTQMEILPFELLRQQCFIGMVNEAAIAGSPEEAEECCKSAQSGVNQELFKISSMILGGPFEWQQLMVNRDANAINDYILQFKLEPAVLFANMGLDEEPSDDFSTYMLEFLSSHIEMTQNSLKFFLTETWNETRLPKDDEIFFRAVHSIEKCLKMAEQRGDFFSVVHRYSGLTRTYAHFDTLNVMYFVEKANAIMSDSLDQQADPSSHAVQELLKQVDVKAYLAGTSSPVVEFGRKVLLQIADKLYTMPGLTSKDWIRMQESHKGICNCLQSHYQKKYLLDTFLHKFMGTDPELTREDREKSKVCAFLWSERQRARAMLYQVGPNKLSTLAARELRAFDIDDAFAMEALEMEGTTLEKGTVFVEYSYDAERWQCRIFIRNQDGDLSMDQICDWSWLEVEKRLKNLLSYLNPEESKKDSRRQEKSIGECLYSEDDMHKDLEYFYDQLIKPIAHHLASMNPEDKLIFAPNEQLNKVPFAALRDSSKPPGCGYLIQSHTISITPSLRVLKKCHDRLQALHKLPLYPGPGSIVALGDPAYGSYHKRLKSTGKEVECIEALFGETRVVKLLGTDATAESLLQWAQKPSCDAEQLFRQAVFHIGAHGDVHWKQHSNGVLHLARTNARPYPPDHPNDARTNGNVSRVFSSFSKDDCDPDPGDDDDDDDDFPQTSSTAAESEESEIFRSTRHTSISNSIKSGALKAEQISTVSKFEWASEMVILSACNTAMGENSAEGVLSLARAFMMAGAPCIVASQWKVMDESTSVLMEGFYRNLKGGKDVASALRASLLAMIHNEETHKVHQWAPFIVWGLPTVCLPQALQAA